MEAIGAMGSSASYANWPKAKQLDKVISMTATIILIGFLLFFFTAFIVTSIRFQDERNKNFRIQGEFHPYTKRASFLTGGEKKLFSLLQSSALLSNYYIFPQLHLSTLLEVKDDAKDMQGKFEWLNKLYVDFIIFDKEKIEPVLVIGLNDQTHQWGSRKARDEFVRKALDENGIPLITIKTNDIADFAKIEDKIAEVLASKGLQ